MEELTIGNVLSKEKKEVSRSDEKEDDRDTDSSNSDSSSDSDSDSEDEYECEVCEKTFSSYLSLRQHQKGKKHAKAVLKKKKEKKLLNMDTTKESDDEDQIVQEPYAECKICKKEFYGPEAYEQHLKSKKHKQKALEASILEQVQEEGKINVDKLRDLCKSKQTSDDVLENVKQKITPLTLDDEDNKEEEFECKECEKLFSGLIPYTQHLMSKTHAKKVEKNSLFHKVIPGTSKEEENPVKSEHGELNTLCIEDDVLICKSCSTSFSGPENALTHMKSKKHAKNLEKYIRKLEKRKEKKRTKEPDAEPSKENKEKAINESHDETTKKQPQSVPNTSSEQEVASSPANTSVKPSTSTNKDSNEFLAFEKYKEYKAIMNSPEEKDILK